MINKYSLEGLKEIPQEMTIGGKSVKPFENCKLAYIHNIRRGDYKIVKFDGEDSNKLAIRDSITGGIVSTWMPEDQLRHYMLINYGVKMKL